MKAAQCSRIAFTSTAVVYGNLQDTTDVHLEWPLRAIRETGAGFPQQTSIYGAMKLASESLIAAYCEGYGCIGDIYRLVSVVGPGYRHGNLMDFYTRLSENPSTLTLFGSPTQEKYYIAVEDVMDAIARTVARDHRGCDLWNVSHHAPNTIGDSISAVAEALGIPYPSVLGGASWPGDLPQLVLDCSKLRALGWVPNKSIALAMRETVEDLIARGV
jgi:UDP-glucose 4-epimerase